MAKIYTKNTWQDEILSGDERYSIQEDNGSAFKALMRIVLSTSVVQAGTPVNAIRMNNIENGIDGLDTLVDAINTMLGSSPKGNYADVAARLAAMDTGWIEDSVPWTYASGTTATRPGATITQFPVGVKLRYKQGGPYKYAYGVGVSGTTITAIGDGFTNAAITNVAYSYADNPQGFSHWFSFTCNPYGSTGSAGAYAESSSLARICIIGRTAFVKIVKVIANLGSWGGTVYIPLPINAVNSYAVDDPSGAIWANGAAAGSPRGIAEYISGGGAVIFASNIGTSAVQWSGMAVNDRISINTQYEI